MLEVLLVRETAGPEHGVERLSIVRLGQLVISLVLEVIPEQVEAGLGQIPAALEHPVADDLRGVPAVDVHLVAAHVEEVGLEVAQHVHEDALEDLVDLLAGRIELTAWRLHAVALPRLGFEADRRVVAHLWQR